MPGSTRAALARPGRPEDHRQRPELKTGNIDDRHRGCAAVLVRRVGTGRLVHRASPVFDDKIRERFAATCGAVAGGRLDWWRETARGCVALCLLFDQFPRNLFRGTAKAFATDERAR